MRMKQILFVLALVMHSHSAAADKSISDVGKDIVNGLKSFWNGGYS
jgi:hypothetical protein